MVQADKRGLAVECQSVMLTGFLSRAVLEFLQPCNESKKTVRREKARRLKEPKGFLKNPKRTRGEGGPSPVE